jgi:hypothetical protein
MFTFSILHYSWLTATLVPFPLNVCVIIDAVSERALKWANPWNSSCAKCKIESHENRICTAAHRNQIKSAAEGKKERMRAASWWKIDKGWLNFKHRVAAVTRRQRDFVLLLIHWFALLIIFQSPYIYAGGVHHLLSSFNPALTCSRCAFDFYAEGAPGSGFYLVLSSISKSI